MLPAGSFARSVGVLSGGTAFAHGIALLALPVLTRLYGPEDFSLLAVYIAVLEIVTVVSCLRYNIAIPLPKDDLDGMALLLISLLAATAVSFLCALPVILIPETTSTLIGQPDLKPHLWMLPLGIFFGSSYNALQYWVTRKKRFVLLTQTRITRALGGIGAQFGLGVVNPSPFGLILGQMIYSGLGIVKLARMTMRDDRKMIELISKSQMATVASTYRHFPQYSVLEALFNTAGIYLPLIMIASMVDEPEAAFLFLAMRIMALPMALVGSSVSQVFLAEVGTKLRDGTLSVFTRRTMWSLFKTGAPPIIAIGIFSPAIFPQVLGEDWAPAGWLVSWMTPWFVLQFVASPVSMTLHVTGRVALAMGLQAFGLLLRVGIVLIMFEFAPAFLSEVYALTGAVFYGFYLAVIHLTLRTKKSNSLK